MLNGRLESVTLKVYDLATNQEILQNVCTIPHRFTSVVFSRNSKVLAANWPNEGCLWEIPSGKLIARFIDQPGYSNHLSLSPDGKLLAIVGWGSDEGVAILDGETGKVKGTFPSFETGKAMCKEGRFAPDGRTLAINNWEINGQDQGVPIEIKLWKLPPAWLPEG